MSESYDTIDRFLRANLDDQGYAAYSHVLDSLWNEAVSDGVNISRLQYMAERDLAIQLLAEWCVSVQMNGTGWSDWSESYKDVAFRPGPLRELLDAAIAKERKERG